MSQIKELSPREYVDSCASGFKAQLVDVREGFERNICKLEDDLHIPMGEIQQRLHEMNRDSAIVLYCRSGSRSLAVGQFLLNQGFSEVYNLKGGILAWADEIDPQIQQY